MKYLINFIEAKNVTKAKIFPHLKCNRQEAKILQYICRRFVKGIEETAVLDILQDNFEYESYDYLNYLSVIKKLMDMGWIVQISFGQVKVQEVSKLEVLNTSVAPTMSLIRLLEEGSLEISLPDIKPYTDHLEYLQDQFDVIDLLFNMSNSKQGFLETSLSVGQLKSSSSKK